MESSQHEPGPQVKIRKIARRLRITGTVQGVGFRAALCDVARNHGLEGWVRNRKDGSVEAEIAGAPEAVAALVDWSRRGPPAARVADVRVETINAAEALSGGFSQRPTL